MFRENAAGESPERPVRAPLDLALLLMTALYALLPFGRLLVTGEGNQVDMGVATILLFLVGASLLERRRRSPRGMEER